MDSTLGTNLRTNSVGSNLRRLGSNTIQVVGQIGRVTIFSCCATLMIFIPPVKIRHVIAQIYFIGVISIFVVSLTALFTGMVLGLQGYYTLSNFGAEGLLGSAVALSLIRELGPVLTALMVTGRAGSSIAAKLGSMRITEQIDALETMDISPLEYLISPRIAATVLSLPLLTAIFDLVGIFGGYLTGVIMLDINAGIFLDGVTSSTKMRDIISGFVKPLFFGFIIATICCYRGFYCDRLRHGVRGAEGVSLATTSSVVISSVLILVVDYVLTAFLL